MPEIYTYETDIENPVKVPYTLEAFCEGQLLSEQWDNAAWTTEEKRTKVLTQLAQHMTSLYTFQFDKIGTPQFDQSGNTITDIGPILDRNMIHQPFGKCITKATCFTTRDYVQSRHKDPLKDPSRARYVGAYYHLASLAIASIPDKLNEQPFALSHGDYNLQNIFVDDEGNVTGIIDWDNTDAMTPALGSLRYPIWITADWDPINYGWGEEDEDGDIRPYDSSGTLLKYRKIYTAALKDAMINRGPKNKALETEEREDAHMALSQILEAVWLARAHDSVASPWVLMKLLDWAFRGKPPCTLREYIKRWEVDGAEEWSEMIARAFEGMWRPETDDLEEYEKDCERFLRGIRA